MEILSFNFIFNLIYFFISVFIAFYIPASFFVKKLKLTFFQESVISVIFGSLLFAWQGWILGYLNLRWATYIYLLAFFAIWIKSGKYKEILIKLKLKNIQKYDRVILFILITGVLIQVSSLFFVGSRINDGLYFCCGNLFDNLLHISYANEISNRIPPLEPGMSNQAMINYHYWANLISGEMVRVFNLPVIQTSISFFGLFTSIFLGLSAILLGQVLNLGKIFTRWLIFFLYFGGDLIYLVLSLITKKVNFTMSSLEDGARFLENPPRALSIVVFFMSLSLLSLWIKKRNKYLDFIFILSFATLIGLKVYTGIFALVGLFFLAIYFLIKRKYSHIGVIVFTALVSLAVYLPVNSNAGGIYFIGLWRFNNFAVQPQFGLVRLELAKEIYLAHNNWIRVFMTEAFYAVFYIVLIFGTKIVALLQTKKSLSLLSREINIFLIGGIIVSLFAGFFFNQTSGGSNTFNFLANVFIIGSIYSSLALTYWSKKIGKFSLILVIFIVILTIPRPLFTFYHNVNDLINKTGFVITNNQLSAFEYIKNNTPEDALIMVDHRYLDRDAQSPYVSVFTQRQMFLSGMENELKAHNIDFRKREISKENIIKKYSAVLVAKELLRNNVNYILLHSSGLLTATDSARFFKEVYRNDEAKIWEVSSLEIRKYLKEEDEEDI